MSLLNAVLADMIHIVKIILIGDMFFMFRMRENKYKKNRIAIIMLAMFILSIGIYKSENIILNAVIYIVSVLAFICYLYRERIVKIILSTVWIIFVISMLDIMSEILVKSVYTIMNVKYQTLTELFASIISLVFVLILGSFFKKKSNIGIKNVGIKTLIIFSFLAVADTFIVMLMARTIEKQNMNNILFIILFGIVVIGIFFQLSIVIILFVQRNLYMKEKQIIEKYLNEQKNYYEYLEEREKETKKFRHDLRNHMQMLSNLVRDEKYNDFDNYFKKINIKIDNFGNLITVHNGIVDAIINQYYSIAKQKNIKMEVNGRFPEKCTIDAFDLCTIFSNVLSNAVESSDESDEKKITLNCRYTENNIIVIVKNSFKDVGQFNNGKIQTRKVDADYHGFGLDNIKDSIKANNGILDINIRNNEFMLTILLNYKECRIDENSYCG